MTMAVSTGSTAKQICQRLVEEHSELHAFTGEELSLSFAGLVLEADVPLHELDVQEAATFHVVPDHERMAARTLSEAAQIEVERQAAEAAKAKETVPPIQNISLQNQHFLDVLAQNRAKFEQDMAQIDNFFDKIDLAIQVQQRIDELDESTTTYRQPTAGPNYGLDFVELQRTCGRVCSF